MTPTPDLPDAVAIAEAVRSGRTCAAEVVDAHLRRAADLNPRLNALTTVFADRARRCADEVDSALAQGQDPGPLAGVPVSVKDNIDLTWSATTEGWRGAVGAVPRRDATVVTRVRAAGAIPVGRGNMPDFGMRWDTDNDLAGRTLHPLDPARTVFGSSGGDAVAVATGMSALGLGNDFGGSVRLPASALGICGLRPSLGRVPRAAVGAEPVGMAQQRFSVNGLLARSVRDLRHVLPLVSGWDEHDPVSLDLPPLSAHEGPRRVALVRDPLGWGVDPQVAAAVDRAAASLAAAGWELVEAEPPMLEQAAVLWRRLAVTDVRWSLDPARLPRPLGRSATTFLRDSTAVARPFTSAADLVQAWAQHAVVAAAWRRFQREVPLVLGPVFTQRLPQVDFDLGGQEAAQAAWRALRLVVAVNFLGLPAAALPAGTDSDGMPLSVQLVGPLHGEAAVLAAAADL